jgi:hypothetical protein
MAVALTPQSRAERSWSGQVGAQNDLRGCACSDSHGIHLQVVQLLLSHGALGQRTYVERGPSNLRSFYLKSWWKRLRRTTRAVLLFAKNSRLFRVASYGKGMHGMFSQFARVHRRGHDYDVL